MSSCFYFIPARGGSKRFPRKNIALLDGKPLIAHVIDSVRIADPNGEIIVSTDDNSIEAVVSKHRADNKIPNLAIDRRAPELGSDTASIAHVLQEYIRRKSPAQENCLCVYATAALVSPSVLRENLEKFETNKSLRSLMGGSEFNLHPWQALYKSEESGSYVPYFPDLFLKRSQEFPKFCASNGSFYLVRTKAFLEEPNFYAQPLEMAVTLDEWVDINYPHDIHIVERILEKRRERAQL